MTLPAPRPRHSKARAGRAGGMAPPSQRTARMPRSVALLAFFAVCALLYFVISAGDKQEVPTAALRHQAVQEYVGVLEREVARLEKEIHSNIAHLKNRVEVPVVHAAQVPVVVVPSAEQVAAAPSAPEPDPELVSAIDPDFFHWKSALRDKLVCKAQRKALYYHYHTRKAAGTSIRDAIKMSARLSGIAYVETEGVVLNASILDSPGVLSVTSLRNPVDRVMSLYWYEHAGWYVGILKQPQRCKPLADWVAAWSDGSAHKSALQAKNPGNNYVEVENYYVKMLVGKTKVTRDDLDLAKAVLRKFDLVMISEWMGDETEIDAFNAVFKGRRQVSVGHQVTGDRRMRDRLKATLAPDEAEVAKRLTTMNALDLELYEYAQSLMALRLKAVVSLANDAAVAGANSMSDPSKCVQSTMNIMQQFRKVLGVFQPPGHKGP